MSLTSKVIKSIKKPGKAIRFISFLAHYFFRKRKGVLFFIGMDPKGVFNLMHHGFEKCYGFEANPERYKRLVKKFKNNPRVKLINAAVAQYDGEIILNVSSNNNGASSSIGKFREDWQEDFKGKKIKMIKEVKVPCLNLVNYCKQNNINFIDEYFSDIQGMDLEVLKTLSEYISEKKIGAITCEVAHNEKGNVYKDLPNNTEEGFNALLSENYTMVAKGWGALKDGRFDTISKDAWEFDCKWKLKESKI